MSLPSQSEKDPADEESRSQVDPGTNNRPTRLLCEAMYLDGTLRRSIMAAFLGRVVGAWAPNYGLDITAVLRHAWRAQRWERGRNIALCAVMAVVLVAPACRWAIRGDGPLAVTVAALLLPHVVLTRTVRQRRFTLRTALKELWDLYKRSQARVRRCAWLLLSCTILFGWLVVRLVCLEDLVLVLAGVVGIWGIGLVDAYVVVGRARRCRHAVGDRVRLLRDDAPVLPAHLEQRLRTLGEGPDPDQKPDPDKKKPPAEARVVVYDLEWRDDNTFIGSGELISEVDYRVDTSVGRVGSDGERQRAKRVDLVRLHGAIEHSMRKAAVPDLWCGYRMYVNGMDLQADDVLPDRRKVPVARLPRDYVLRFLDETLPNRRTYLCVQVPVAGRDGDIMVTLFLRGQLIGDQLLLLSKILILPTMQLGSAGWPGKKPGDDWTHLQQALHVGTTRIWAVALRSPRQLVSDALAAVRRRWRQAGILRDVKHDRMHRYGAVDSIREQLAVGAAIFTPNAMEDIQGTVTFLEQMHVKAIKEYLVSRRIDTSAFDGFVQNVYNQHQNKIDQLNAKNVTFGSKSRAGDTAKTGAPSATSGES